MPAGIWADVVDSLSGRRYGGMECTHGIPDRGDFLLTREPRGRGVTEPVTWVVVVEVAWIPEQHRVVLGVRKAILPTYLSQAVDGT
jgi:hypothetical protein